MYGYDSDTERIDIEREHWLIAMYKNIQLKTMDDKAVRKFLNAGRFMPEIIDEFLMLRHVIHEREEFMRTGGAFGSYGVHE